MKRCYEKILDKAYDLAFGCEAKYGSCSQCVLRALRKVFQLKNMHPVIKAAHALAGGLGAYLEMAVVVPWLKGHGIKLFV